MTIIIPAIIEETRKDIMREVDRVRGFVDTVQIDVLDGVLGHTKTWPFTDDNARDELEILKNINIKLVEGNMRVELDLMIDRPEYFMDLLIGTGASAFIFHIDSTSIMNNLIYKVKDAGLEAGIAIRPSHENELLLPYLNKIDFVQFMGSDKIGYHGVSLDERVYEKVINLRKINPGVTIAVDIGVNKETAPRLVEAGVDKLVVGSAIFGADDIKGAVDFFSNL